MKKLVLFAVALLVCAAPAMAGVDLLWDTCAPGGVATKTLVCSDGNANVLYASWEQPVTLSGNFIGVDYTWDVQTQAAATPAFWDFNTPTSAASCNFFYLLQKNRAGCTTASNLWGFNGGSATASFNYGAQFNGVPNRGRCVGSVVRSAASPTTANAGTSYYLLHLELYGDAESNGCPGCTQPAAIVFNQATLLSLGNGAEAAPIPVTGPGLVSNCASANGGDTICGATPTQNKTWGALKSLYR